MATPIMHVSNPMRVAAPNQVLHSFLILFLLFTSSVSQRFANQATSLRSHLRAATNRTLRPGHRRPRSHGSQLSLCRLLRLFRHAFHSHRGLIFGLHYLRIPFIIINPCQVNMRPCQHHGILRRRMLANRQPPKYLLGPCRIVIQHRDQSDSVPCPCLVRIFRQHFLKSRLCRARIFLRDPPLALRQRREDFGIVRHRRWYHLLLARDLFSRCLIFYTRWLARASTTPLSPVCPSPPPPPPPPPPP